MPAYRRGASAGGLGMGGGPGGMSGLTLGSGAPEGAWVSDLEQAAHPSKMSDRHRRINHGFITMELLGF